MALTKGAKGHTERGQSPPDEVKRAGRPVPRGAKGYTEAGKDPGSDADRSKRDSGAGPNGSGLGIGKGDADKGGKSVSRIDDKISSV